MSGDHHLALTRLTPDQIADVLIKMGAPVDVVVQEPKVFGRLVELTEGEPIMLRLYAEDLWQKAKGQSTICRADLDQLKPGFASYFEYWLELQKRQWSSTQDTVDLGNFDRVLALLSGAKGPLPGADLLAIFKSCFPEVSCPPTSRALLEPLRRFVIGDGKDLPYVLGHPKFGEVISDELCHELMATVDTGFAKWGRQHVDALNQGRINSEDASKYALQFLRYHFAHVKAPAKDFMCLVKDGWRRAWELFEGGQRGFSADVQAAWKTLREDGILAHLGSQWRCVLVLSSIRSLSHSLPSKILLGLASL